MSFGSGRSLPHLSCEAATNSTRTNPSFYRIYLKICRVQPKSGLSLCSYVFLFFSWLLCAAHLLGVEYCPTTLRPSFKTPSIYMPLRVSTIE